MTTTTAPRTASTTTQRATTARNPWTPLLAVAAVALLGLGAILVGGNTDPSQMDYSPATYQVGLQLILGGIITGAILFAVCAINWQLRRR